MDKEAQKVFYKTAKSFEKVLDHLSVGVTPILGATLIGDVDLLEDLINAGFDPNKGNSPRYGGPLQQAARFGYDKIAGLLVEGGANVTEKEMKAAIDGKSLECIELMLAPYIAYCGPGRGATELLIAAAGCGHAGILRALLEAPLGYEGDRLSKAPAGMPLSALGTAISKDGASSVRALIDHGADIHEYVIVHGKRKSYLHYACDEAGGEVLRVLLDAGLDVNEAENGNLPIHVVASMGAQSEEAAKRQVEVMQVLLECGADITAKSASGRSLMQIVARTEALRQLISSARTANSVEAAIETQHGGEGDGLSATHRHSGISPL